MKQKKAARTSKAGQLFCKAGLKEHASKPLSYIPNRYVHTDYLSPAGASTIS